jgi:sugar lactone lactonase YvrE
MDSTVLITGAGFSKTLAENIVTFNGKTATVTSASDTVLAVTVPHTVQDGKITVSVSGHADSTTKDFTYLYTVTTFAGTGGYGSADGQGTQASFGAPQALALDAAGNIYVSDAPLKTIRKITKDGAVTTYAGTDPMSAAVGQISSIVVADASGILYCSDAYLSEILKVTPDGKTAVFAGRSPGYVNGVGRAASFYGPGGIAMDAGGNLCVGDAGNYVIRKITPDTVVSTYAFANHIGFLDGAIDVAQTNTISDLKINAAGTIYTVEIDGRLRTISGSTVSTLAGDGTQADADGIGTAAKFNFPLGIALDAAGNSYVTEYYGNRIRKVSPSGKVRTIAGTGNPGHSDGIGPKATFGGKIMGIGVTADGTIYVADASNYEIRRLQ